MKLPIGNLIDIEKIEIQAGATVLASLVAEEEQMNTKLIIFSAVVTAAVGAAIGTVAAAVFPCPYTSQLYQNLDRKYAIIGAVGGLLVGASQEMIRELKQESDLLEETEERKKAAFFHLNDRN